MRRIILIGAGALAKEIAEWIGIDRIGGFLVDPEYVPEVGWHWNQLTILGNIESAKEIAKTRNYDFVIAIADSNIKRHIAEKLRGIPFGSYAHPLSYVARTATICNGAILGPFAVAGNDSLIGEHVVMNYHAVAGHDAMIGDYSTLSPHAALMGNARTGVGCFMGTGAKILPRVEVPADTRISAGAIVRRSLTSEGCTLYGDPAEARP